MLFSMPKLHVNIQDPASNAYHVNVCENIICLHEWNIIEIKIKTIVQYILTTFVPSHELVVGFLTYE